MDALQLDLRDAPEPELDAARDLAAWMDAERAADRAAWFDLPLAEGPAEEARAWWAAAPDVGHVLLAGIGGSALTARVVDAIRPLPGHGPQLHVLDTVDPRTVETVMRTLDPADCVLVGISKSGGTLETTAVFLVLEAWLREALGENAPGHIGVIAGAQDNALRAHAESHGYAVLPIPVGVGGRFSALTPVGLLPAAAVGLDPRELLRGAAAVRDAALLEDPAANPALALAGVHVAAERMGRGVAVLMPYGQALQPLGPWWAQLVGESLGKSREAGVTPVAASGPADQHSLQQLLVEGAQDKLVVVVTAGAEAGPAVPGGAGLCYAEGRSLGAILAAEAQATAEAVAAAGQSVVRLHLPAADAFQVGAFLFAYEMAVVLWGRALQVDPFGQPGVEGGKQAARRLLTDE